MAVIEAQEDLYNGGKCFTKGKRYELPANVKTEAGLMEKMVINDQGEMHKISSWWRKFKLIKSD